MKDAKSQFVLSGTGYGQGDYLKNSLSMMGADTRGGLRPETAATLNRMAVYVDAHQDTTSPERFHAYAAKLASAPAAGDTKPAASAQSKPGSGMM